MISVTCEVNVYEKDICEKVLVKNHWNQPEKIALWVDGREYIVLADDLITAIKNATNTKRF